LLIAEHMALCCVVLCCVAVPGHAPAAPWQTSTHLAIISALLDNLRRHPAGRKQQTAGLVNRATRCNVPSCKSTNTRTYVLTTTLTPTPTYNTPYTHQTTQPSYTTPYPPMGCPNEGLPLAHGGGELRRHAEICQLDLAHLYMDGCITSMYEPMNWMCRGWMLWLYAVEQVLRGVSSKRLFERQVYMRLPP
jgi:hypothetical protein